VVAKVGKMLERKVAKDGEKIHSSYELKAT